jgi:hypothetical protein
MFLRLCRSNTYVSTACSQINDPPSFAASSFATDKSSSSPSFTNPRPPAPCLIPIRMTTTGTMPPRFPNNAWLRDSPSDLVRPELYPPFFVGRPHVLGEMKVELSGSEEPEEGGVVEPARCIWGEEVRRMSGKKGRMNGRLVDWVDRVQKHRGGKFRGE